MITVATLGEVAAMVPVIALTVLAGRWLAKRINRGVFSTLIVVLTLVTAVQLLA